MSKKLVEQLAKDLNGTVEEISDPLPDGSGFAVVSFPLPKDHWLTQEGVNEPPMPFRVGEGEERSGLAREDWAEHIRTAARYAIRASTMNGKDNDFDPDAMVQNFIVGMLGYWTPDGLSHL